MMIQEKSKVVATFLPIQLDNKQLELNEIMIKKTNMVTQIEGYGKVANVEEIKLDISDLIDKILEKSFKLDLKLEIKGQEYNYSKIYVNSEIPRDGVLTVGNISVIGEINENEIKIEANITNIDTR